MADVIEELKAAVHGEMDRLRAAVPALEQAALDHVRAAAGAMLEEFRAVLDRIEGNNEAPAPTPAAPLDPTSPSRPVSSAPPNMSPTPSIPPSTPLSSLSETPAVPSPAEQPSSPATPSETATAPEAPAAPTPGV